MLKKFILFLIVIFGFGLWFYCSKIEPEQLVLRQETLYIPHWNKDLDGFKIGVISDLHIGMPNVDINKIEQVVNMVNAEQPDIIVLLGDFDAKAIYNSGIPEDEISASLKKLKAPDGIYAIPGNHDYEPEEIINRIIKNANIPMLENDSKTIRHKNKKIRIVGFKDWWHFKSYPPDVIGKISPNIPVLVLAHNPDLFPEMPDGISLMLSGHNHGGEVSFPTIGSPFVPSEYGQKYQKGYIVENNKHLFVTSGIGTLSGFRLMNPPEVVILTINQQTEDKTIENTQSKNFFGKNYAKYYLILKKNIRMFGSR